MEQGKPEPESTEQFNEEDLDELVDMARSSGIPKEFAIILAKNILRHGWIKPKK